MEIKQEIDEDSDENVLILKDLKTVPDIIHEYTAKEQKSALIIDNGSFMVNISD